MSASRTNELPYLIALGYVPGIGPALTRALGAYFGDYATVFRQTQAELERVPGIGPQTAQALSEALRDGKAIQAAEAEIAFCEKHKLLILQPGDEFYPPLLRDIADAPLVLFYRGNPAPLKLGAQSVSIVGTRRASAYGRDMVSKLVSGLAAATRNLCIVSGLAHGIDGEAHKSALAAGVPTIGVLGHGFRHFYPASHRELASRMLESGGLLTEFASTKVPDNRTFLQRNRIIAGMAAATVVGESAKKGGAMVTAEYAASCRRDIFAFPGNVGSPMSEGCNWLIKNRQAGLIEGAEDLIRAMGWTPAKQRAVEASLFYTPTEEERGVMEAIREAGRISMDELARDLGMPLGLLNALLFNLEMNGVVRQLPGKNFEMGL